MITTTINRSAKNPIQFNIAGFFMSLMVAVSLVLLPSPTQAEIRFQEVTDTAGLFDNTRSCGSSWADFSGDGLPDLWVGNHNYGGRLFRNLGNGIFADATTPELAYHEDRHGAAWADFDNDGDPDLLVLVGADKGTGNLPNQFFVNTNGVLTDRAQSLGLDYGYGRGRTPLWVDWDADGDLDVLVVNKKRVDGLAPTTLFTQQAGRFSSLPAGNLFPITDDYLFFAQLSLSNSEATHAPVVVIHHERSYPGRIYQFGADGFRNVAPQFGFPKIDGTVTDVAVADFDGDLVNDFFLTRSDRSLSDKLFVQRPGGMVDATVTAGLGSPSRGSESVVAADFDNDMDLDLYIVRTDAEANYYNLLYENLGDGTFRKVTGAGGAIGSMLGIGNDVTTADFDLDGFVDLFITNGAKTSQGPNQLFKNAGNGNRWLEIDLVGTVSNRDGIGARLIARAGGVSQLREKNGGMHRFSQDHSRIHFGLGANPRVDRLTVYWPSGIVQVVDDIATNQIVRIVEPQASGQIPFADAGGPYDAVDTNGTGWARVTLDGSASFDADGQIVSYGWYDADGQQISSGVNPTLPFMAGENTVTLTVTDNDGNTHSDTTVVIVTSTGGGTGQPTIGSAEVPVKHKS